MSNETCWGLSFLALAMSFTSAEISAANSSSFSYKNFVIDAETEANARDAMLHSCIWATLGNIAVSAMSYIATGKDIRWSAATFLAGESVLALHMLHFDKVLKENREKYGYAYPPP